MLISFIRAFILLLTVMVSLRLMGKRQIGQLQPGELVITILLSDIIANPMQDNDIPLLNTLVAVAVLVGVELMFSVLGMKLPSLRKVLEGNPVILVKNGKPDQKQLKRLRYTVDDLAEGLRAKGIFRLSEVALAIAETDGSLNVLVKEQNKPVNNLTFGADIREPGMPVAVIKDGVISKDGMKQAKLDEKRLRDLIKRQATPVEDIFLLTVDATGETELIKKEK